MSQKKTVLLADNSLYASMTISILNKGNFEIIQITSKEDFDSLKNEEKTISLILLDTSFIEITGSDFIDELREIYNAPLVLTSEDDIDDHFTMILEKEIKQVLNKPIKGTELLNVANKLISPDPKTWFGLQNYLPNMNRLKKVRITKSTQIRTVITSMLKICEDWGFNFDLKFEMDLVWQEILTNAIYHSHGYGEYKKNRQAIQLPEGFHVDIRFGANENQFGISVRDYRGTLTPRTILESLKVSIEQQSLLEKSAETGEDITDQILDRGRGIDLIRRMTGEYYFVIDPGKSTEIIIIYDAAYEKDDNFSSLKIFQLPGAAAVEV